jgi:Protein of unknown function (DUF2442)
MWDMNEITRVRHVRGHVCHIEFDDGSSGEIDLTAYLDKGPIFAALADIELFKQVRIEGGTICWPNGADIAPERLYEMVHPATTSLEPTR